MNKISSNNAFVLKYILPILALSIMTYTVVNSFISPIDPNRSFGFETVLSSIVLLIFFRFFWRYCFFSAEEVRVDDESLFIRNGKEIKKIPLKNIRDVLMDMSLKHVTVIYKLSAKKPIEKTIFFIKDLEAAELLKDLWINKKSQE